MLVRAAGDAPAPHLGAVIGDMRYSLSARAFDPIWGIRFTAPGAAAEVDWVNRSRDRRISLAGWWAEVSGASPEHHALAGLKRPERGK